jgi:hypothetical protein
LACSRRFRHSGAGIVDRLSRVPGLLVYRLVFDGTPIVTFL